MKLASYNCNGFSSNSQYASKLLSQVDVLLLQEHWLYTENLSLLLDLDDYCNFHAVCGMNDSQEVIRGRPYGGVAIIWKNQFDKYIEIIPSESKRVCAILIELEQVKCVIVNVYMPCDPRTQNIERVPEFVEVLQAIDSCIVSSGADHVILAGDFNTDFSRNNAHSKLLSNFVTCESLINCSSVLNV